jgi:hypothetical protein
MDYVGSDNSGLGSVWIYSGPIWTLFDQIILVLGSIWIYSGPMWVTLGQIILVWDQYGFMRDQ